MKNRLAYLSTLSCLLFGSPAANSSITSWADVIQQWQNGNGNILFDGNLIADSMILLNDGQSLNIHGAGFTISGNNPALPNDTRPFENRGFLSISNCVFKGNHLKPQGGMAGGVISNSSFLFLSNCDFIGNYDLGTGGTSVSEGGAIFLSGVGVFVDCSFFSNYMLGRYNRGAAISIQSHSKLHLVADREDVVFKGNRVQVEAVNEDGTFIGGRSEGIFFRVVMPTSSNAIDMSASQNGSIIFYDDIHSDCSLASININPNFVHDPSQKPTSTVKIVNPYRHDGIVIIKDGVSWKNVTVNLLNGTLSMGNGTIIKGVVNASPGSTFRIEGFTSLDEHDSRPLGMGAPDDIIPGLYSVTTDKPGTHTIFIKMNDEMAAATENNPVWSFKNGSSIKAGLGAIDFVLDISGIRIRPEELHPYIFSHFGQEPELIGSVVSAKSVRLIDSDGWTYKIEGNYFDYLSGQYSINPEGEGNGDGGGAKPNTPEWKAPGGVGGDQANTLGSSGRSLWSFADNARNQGRMRFRGVPEAAIWISGLGDYYSQKNQIGADGYSYRSLGSSMGGEYAFASRWSAGFAIGESWGKQEVNMNRGKIDQQVSMGLFYANRMIELDQANRMDIGVQAGYAQAGNKGEVQSNDLNDRLAGQWTDHAWMLDMKVNWMHTLTQKFMLETYGGLQYSDISQNDFTLKGEQYNYRVKDGSMNSLRVSMGSGVRYHSNPNGRGTLLYARCGVIQEALREAPHVTVQGNIRTWRAEGCKPGRIALHVATGGRMSLTDDLSLGGDYSLESAENTLIQSGRVSLIYEF